MSNEKKKLFYPEQPAEENPDLGFEDRIHGMLVFCPDFDRSNRTWMVPMVMQDIQTKEIGITVLDTGSDLAWAAALAAKEAGRPYVMFDPLQKDCPCFNPLEGSEDEVITRMTDVYKAVNPDCPRFFLDVADEVLTNSIKLLKRLDKDNGTDGYYSNFAWMSCMLQNSNGQGRTLVQKLTHITSSTPDEAKENTNIASWFLNEYFVEGAKAYENSVGLRSFIRSLNQNRYMGSVLNPKTEDEKKLDFSEVLDQNGVLCISIEKGKFRNLTIPVAQMLLDALRIAIWNRGNRNQHALYISLEQPFLPLSFPDFMSEARRKNVAVTINAFCQERMLYAPAQKEVKIAISSIIDNGRNLVTYGGGSAADDTKISPAFVRAGDSEDGSPYDSKTKFAKRSFASTACRFISNEDYLPPVEITPSDRASVFIEKAQKFREKRMD